MEFHDYRKFAQKEIACSLVSDPEPGTKLVGAVAILEELSKVQNSDNLFRPLAQNDDRFRGVQVSTKQLQDFFASNGPIVWPAVRSGNLHGKLAMYVGVDGAGNVRETWPLNSDNAGLEDPARAQVMKWTMKGPVDADGYAVQIDGALGFAFDTNIGDPLPLLDDIETRRLARTIIEPVLTQSGLPSGQVIQVDIGVNEQGNLTGETFPKLPDAAVGALLQSLSKWEFNPLIRDGRPQYFHGILKFKVP